MDIVSFYNDKGGVGKTTMALNVAIAMAVSGKRVLLVDNDPQGSLTVSSISGGVPVREGIDLVYKGDLFITDVISDTIVENLFLVPSGLTLKKYYTQQKEIYNTVVKIIDFMRTDDDFLSLFDIVIFDNPPTQDGLAFYCTTAADKIVIPVSLDSLCFDALIRSYTFIKEQTPEFLDKYVVIVPSQVKNRALHRTYLEAMIKEFHGKNDNTIVSEARIGDRAEIPESIAKKQNLFISHAASDASLQFKKLCLDIFPWLDKEDFMSSMSNAAEGRKKLIREKFKKMVQKRREERINSETQVKEVA